MGLKGRSGGLYGLYVDMQSCAVVRGARCADIRTTAQPARICDSSDPTGPSRGERRIRVFDTTAQSQSQFVSLAKHRSATLRVPNAYLNECEV